MTSRNVTEAIVGTVDFTGLSMHFNNKTCRVTLHCKGCQVVAGKALGRKESAVHENVKLHVEDALGCGHKVTICKCVTL